RVDQRAERAAPDVHDVVWLVQAVAREEEVRGGVGLKVAARVDRLVDRERREDGDGDEDGQRGGPGGRGGARARWYWWRHLNGGGLSAGHCGRLSGVAR